jgi:(E)-4-hydroxy-3-methylbut-2-enyl-diphosphate synthase
VQVGDIGIGGANPIRVQSMTTTDTMDTAATVAQSIRMIEAGCELVRITAPSKKEAENLAEIKKQLRAQGFTRRWWRTSTSRPTPPRSPRASWRRCA